MYHFIPWYLFLGIIQGTPAPEGATLPVPTLGSFRPQDFKHYLPRKKSFFSSSSCFKFINTVTSNLNAKWCEMSYTKNKVLEMGQHWNICTVYKPVYYFLQFQALLTQFSSIRTQWGVKFWWNFRRNTDKTEYLGHCQWRYFEGISSLLCEIIKMLPFDFTNLVLKVPYKLTRCPLGTQSKKRQEDQKTTIE